ncbi:uncharacterized protein [Diabrotica undecimpunctata]|uniref:uncharacterized protein isoform X1 n=1 Tax=Diabrotica undecimpunctata TaxID=50387 RepID=UPI003B63BA20
MSDIDSIVLSNLATILPDQKYTNFKTLKPNVYQFQCNALKTESDIRDWVKALSEQSYVEWRIFRTNPTLKGHRCVFKIVYRCQHSATRYQSNGKRQSKSTNCDAFLRVKIFQKSVYDESLITQITLNNFHNHPTGITAESLKYRDVSENIKERLRELFNFGLTPSAAHDVLTTDAMIEHGDNCKKVLADRSVVPDLVYCYNFFYKEFGKDYNKVKKGCEHDEPVNEGSTSDKIFNGEDISNFIAPVHCKNSHNIEVVVDDSENEEVVEILISQDNSSDGSKNVDVYNNLKSTFDDILERIKSTQNSDILEASEKFCKNYKTLCKNDKSFKSALKHFGKNTYKKPIVVSRNALRKGFK